MDGYYDPIVSHVLERPLALCGFIGSQVPDIAAHISSYTGIPFVDLERAIEHEEGCSLSRMRGDTERIQKTEIMCIQRWHRIKPHAIIALRPETLCNPDCRILIQKMDLLYVKFDIATVFENITTLLRRSRCTRMIDFQGFDSSDITCMQELLWKYEEGYRLADAHFLPQRHHPRHIAQDIMCEFFP